MKAKNMSITENNLVRFALATVGILLIPLLAGWDWTTSDFIIMGTLIFGTGVAYEVITKILGKKNKVAVAVILVLALLFIWAELAVGLIGTPFAGN
jgi:hypothetical protein